MPAVLLSRLLPGAAADVQEEIAQIGGDTPLLEKYSYTYRELRLEAWQYLSEEEYKVTYNTVLDMINGLQQELVGLDNTECSIDLGPKIGGRVREAGGGRIAFFDTFPPASPDETLSNSTNTANATFSSSSGAANGSLIEYKVQTRVHDTYMIIQKAGKFRKMSEATTSALLLQAYQEVQHLAVLSGGNNPISEDYTYPYRGLNLAAWSHGSPRQTRYKVTYNMISDMIIGLQGNLRRLNDVECTVDLWMVANGRNYPAGTGVLTFADDAVADSPNATASNASPNVTNEVITNLSADRWEYHVPGTSTLLVIQKTYAARTLPVLESLQLFDQASAQIRNNITEYGRDARLVNGRFISIYKTLSLQAYERSPPTEPLTYDMVNDVVTGLKDCFWRVNYAEASFSIDRITDYTAIGLGYGFITFKNAPILSNLTSSGGGFAPLNASSINLQLPGNSGGTSDSLEPQSTGSATA